MMLRVVPLMVLACGGFLAGASIPNTGPPKPSTRPPGAPQYYLMTKVISGDMRKNGSYVVPLPISPPSPNNNNTNITPPLQNQAHIIPPHIPLSTSRLPGYQADFYQEFTASTPNITLGFALPGVDIYNMSQYGDVFMSVDDAELPYDWNAGFSLDEGRGLVFTYAGGRVLSGWVACDSDGEEFPRLYWTWSQTPTLSNSSMSTCAIINLVPIYIPTS